MRKQFIGLNTKAQTAIEYMLLLAAVVSIVLVGFRSYLPSFQTASNYYINQVGIGVLGEPSKCGDGSCSSVEDCEKCPVDCGICFCGDDLCNGGETCSSCPSDCGVCPPPPPDCDGPGESCEFEDNCCNSCNSEDECT